MKPRAKEKNTNKDPDHKITGARDPMVLEMLEERNYNKSNSTPTFSIFGFR
jgi:hypothetical protein